jgi:hypothetical protein
LTQGLKSGIDDAVRGVSGSLGGLSSSAESVFGKMSSGAGLAGLGVAGIGATALVVGKQLYDLGAQWDTITDNITGKTGLVGTELDKVTESIKNVGVNSSASLTEIGDVAGNLVQSLHLTGQPLEDLTTRIADLNELTGDKLNVRDLGKVFHGFGIEADNMGPTLDRLYDVFTNTGIPVSQLIETLKTVGPTARAISPDIGVAAGDIVTLEEAGIDADNAFKGLKIAMGNLSKENAPGALGDFLKDEQGKDLNQKIADLITKIHDTGNIDLARSAFGKSWQPIFEAITNSKLAADDLNKSVSNTGHTIEGSKKATDDTYEEFKKLKNELKDELQPVAKFVFDGINQNLIDTINHIKDIKSAWHNLFGGGDSGLTPGAPGIPAIAGQGPGNALGPLAAGVTGTGPVPGQGVPGINPLLPGFGLTPNASAGAASGQNPLAVFGGHPGPPQLGGGGGSFGAAGAVNNLPNPADMAAIAKAQSLNGLPYTPGTLDCSGYISQIYSAMTGKPTHFTTTANFAALGFQRGYRPGALNIGVTPLPGNSGHMAGTLPNGVNVESGGSSGGVKYGSSTGAQSGQFSDHWYFLPGGYTEGGGIPGYGGGDTVPIRAERGEFIVNKDAAAKFGPLLQSINNGGAVPLADPRGVDPHGGGQHHDESSLGPFAPWWDMDWMPPEHPERIGPSIPGVEGKWWHRGPTGKEKIGGGGGSPWAPPIGKYRPPLPGDPYPGMLPDPQIKTWGYQTGGPVIDPLTTTTPPALTGQDALGAFFGGLQQGGGWGGLIGGFGNMALNASQQAAQATGGPSSVQPGAQPTGKGGGSSQSGAGGALGMAAGMLPGGQVAAALAMRTAKFAGQLMSIGIMGGLETFLPGGTPLSDPSKSLVGRVASGIAGGQPASQNMAGTAKPPQPPPPLGSPASGQGLGPPPGPPGPVNNGVHIDTMVVQNGDGEAAARDINRAFHSQSAGDNSR